MFDVTVLSECIEINTNKNKSTKGQRMPGIIFSSSSVERRMPERARSYLNTFTLAFTLALRLCLNFNNDIYGTRVQLALQDTIKDMAWLKYKWSYLDV